MFVIFFYSIDIEAFSQERGRSEYYESKATVDYMVEVFSVDYDSAICGSYIDSGYFTQKDLMAILDKQLSDSRIVYNSVKIMSENQIKEVQKFLVNKEIYKRCIRIDSKNIVCSDCPQTNSLQYRFLVFFKHGKTQTVISLSKETFEFNVYSRIEHQEFTLYNSCVNSYFQKDFFECWRFN